MANIIKIKRGSGEPGTSDLAYYELGYRTGTEELYINDGGTIRQVGSGSSGGGAVDSIANFADNRVLTASDADSINGEANLTFDGSTLALTGTSTTSGNVGIGGTPVNFTNYVNLDVKTNASGGGVIGFHDSGGTRVGCISHTESVNTFAVEAFNSHPMTFLTNTSEAMRIDSSQNIIMQPTKKLYLDGGGDTYIHEPSANRIGFVTGGNTRLLILPHKTYINSTGANGLVINNDEGTTSNSGRIFFEGTSTSSIFQSGSALSFRSGATAGSSSGTQQMYINSSGMTMFNSINMNANAISGVSGIYGNGGTFIGYNNLYQFKNTTSGILATISGSTLDIPNTGDWSYIKNDTNSGGLRFGTKDSGGNYANQIEISNTGNYVKLNENTSVTGYSGSTSHFQLNFTGSSNSLLKIVNSGWTNETTHDILYNYWSSNIGDYTYLKSAGNSSSGHGIALVGDTLFAVGDTTVATGAVTNSATAPFTDTWFTVNGSGNAELKGYMKIKSGDDFVLGELAGHLRMKGGGTDTFNFLTSGDAYARGNFGTVYTAGYVEAGSGVKVWDSTHGFQTVLMKDSTYTKLLNNDGNVMMYMGDSGDAQMYYQGNEHRFRNLAGSAYYARIGSGYIRSEGDGSAGAPAFSFGSNNNTGMYRVGTDALGFSVGGNIGMQLTSAHALRIYQSDDTTDFMEFYANDSTAYYHHAHGSAHQFITDYGYIQLGPGNSSWGHIQTDRSKFYFNKSITVDSGIVAAYDEDLQLRYREDSSANRIDVANGYTRIIAGNGEKFRVSSDGRVNYNGWTGVDHITVRSNAHTNSASSSTFYIKFCTVVVDNSPTHYNGVNLSGTLYNGDNNHGNTIDWSVWFNAALDSAQIAHGGYMMSKGAHWISNILVQRTGGDGEIDNGTCTYELYYDINSNWANNFYNVATEVHYSSEGKFNVTWNHDQSEVTTLPGTQVVNVVSSTYDDSNQTLVQTGAVGAPSYSFLAQRNTGMYGFTDNTIGFSCNGTRMLSIKADGSLELRNDGNSQGASIQRVGQIQFTWDRANYGTSNNHAIVCDSDNLIINSFDDVTINLDSNNNDGAETFDIRRHATSLTGGELLFQIGGSGTSYTMGASQVGNGSAAAPTLSFYNDTDLGFYRRAANQIGFSTAGEEQMYLADGSLHIAQPVRFQFANDQRIYDDGGGGLAVGSQWNGLTLFGGTNNGIINFKDGGRNGTVRATISGGGVYKWGSGAAHGQLTWDTGKAIVAGMSGNSLELRSTNTSDMIAVETNQTRFIADGTERFRINGNGIDLSNNTATKIVHNNGGSRDKYRVWNSSYYAIGMDATFTYGPLTSYAMTFQMNDEDGRGWWWGHNSHSNAQGAMSLDTDGKLTLAHSMRIGYGESDTTEPGASAALEINGGILSSWNGSAIAKVQSTAGGYGAYSRLTTTTNSYDLVSLNGDFLIDEQGVATRFIIKDSTGHVGFNETSPTTELHLGTCPDGRAITFDQSGRFNGIGNYYSSNATDSYVDFYVSDGGTNGDTNSRMKIYADGRLKLTNSDNADMTLAKATRWGYSSSYKALVIGETSGTYTTAFGYDPSTNSNAQFTGDGRELIFRNGAEFFTPNSANNGWHNDVMVLKDGVACFGHSSPWTSTKLDLGATSNNMRTGSKIYFYDSNRYIGRNGNNIDYYSNSGVHNFTGTIQSNADVVAYYSSDKKLKDNLKPISNSLEKLQKLTGYEFDWNDKQDTYEGHDVGIVAQEVEEVLPEVVATRDSGYKAVKYEKMIPLLIEAIKEQQQQINELKEKLNG